MAKVVIDANVIISAAFGGKPLEAVLRAFRDHEVYVSESIVRELETVFLKLGKKIPHERIPIIQEKPCNLIAFARCIPVSTKVPSPEIPRTTITFLFAKKRKPIFS